MGTWTQSQQASLTFLRSKVWPNGHATGKPDRINDHIGLDQKALGVRIEKSSKTKRGRQEGDGQKKGVTTICDRRHNTLRQIATFYDNVRRFIPLTKDVMKRHNTLCDNSRQIMTIVLPFCRPLLDFAD